ncbi:tetratricopeptide repeat protein [Roseibium algae]|uniref:Tetratricopeptide repeat protein n=1 Tax=Roseibium algae TaxID=3123038 RepID=A0ABU8TPV7_9HYPH
MTTSARDAFDYALDCERRGDPKSALAAYLEALELDPEDMEIIYRTATALLRAGFLEEAASQLRRVVFVEPTHIPARANLGNCQLLMGDMSNAEDNFNSVLEASPDNHNALYGLATVCLKQDKRQQALVTAERLMTLLPENAPALTLYAQAASDDPQASRAAAAYRKALTIDPTYIPALLGLAKLSIRRKRYDEALMFAEKACHLSPSESEPNRVLAEAHEAAGNLQQARAGYTKALTYSGDEKASLLVSLSTISRKLGEYPKALLHAFDAWQRAPGRKDAGNALGAALKNLGRSTDARAILTSMAQGKSLDSALERRLFDLARDLLDQTVSLADEKSLAAQAENEAAAFEITAEIALTGEVTTAEDVASASAIPAGQLDEAPLENRGEKTT